MLTLQSLNVTITDIDSRTLSWTFKSSSEALSSYVLSIYRAESPGGDTLAGYSIVTSGIAANTYGYVDTSLSNLYSPQRTWYYKLLISGIGTANTSIVPTTAAYLQDDTTDNSYNEILRRKSLVINKYSGRDLKILKRRTFGTHCTVCWDSTLMRIKYGDCETCHGTGWLDGYFAAMSVKGMLNPNPVLNQITMYGEWRPSDSLLTILNHPPLTVRDVIVDEKGQRWAVRAVRKVERLGFAIEQQAQLSLISFDDKVYKVSV